MRIINGTLMRVQPKDLINNTIDLPLGIITKVGSDAFRNLGGLKSITLPEGITTIGHRAFASCSRLKDIYIGCNSDIEFARIKALFPADLQQKVSLSPSTRVKSARSVQGFFPGSTDNDDELGSTGADVSPPKLNR